MNPIIKVENFTKTYGNYTAVDTISFTVDEGSIFAFLGPNGAGKSTTINTLCTIFEKTAGKLFIDGKDVTTHKEEVRSVIGVVFQDSTLDPKMTIEENLKMHCVFYHIPKKEVEERIQFVLELVDLLKERKKTVAALSGGMKRRVEIARGLIHYPKVLFLDEPTIGLDIISQRKIRDFISEYNQEEKTTVILTSHYMADIEGLCKRTIVINQGTIVYDGELLKVNDIFNNKKVIKLQFDTEIPSAAFTGFGELKENKDFCITLEMDKDMVNQHMQKMLSLFPIRDFTVEDIPIEEGIALLYQNGGGELA